MEIKNRFTEKTIFASGKGTTKEVIKDAISQGADLEGANLQGADLEWADLQGAYLTGADLQGADLTGANLEGANLEGADLQGAYVQLVIIQGSQHKLQANRDSCSVGCVCHVWDWWTEENIERLVKNRDYSDSQIEEYKKYIEFARIVCEETKPEK